MDFDCNSFLSVFPPKVAIISPVACHTNPVHSILQYMTIPVTLARDEQHLRIFECRILRKMFGPVQNKDGSWRIRMNFELNKLIENADKVRFTKSRRIAWLGHVMRMDDERIPKRILEWKPIVTRIREFWILRMICK
jgi:hypothetical protein